MTKQPQAVAQHVGLAFRPLTLLCQGCANLSALCVRVLQALATAPQLLTMKTDAVKSRCGCRLLADFRMMKELCVLDADCRIMLPLWLPCPHQQCVLQIT